MKHLLTSYWVDPLTPDTFQALAAMSLDPLQLWLVKHALCDGAKPDTMTLTPSARGPDGSQVVHARCAWCGPSSEADIAFGDLAIPAIWWLSLSVRLVVDYQAVLIKADRMPNGELMGRCMQAIEQAIRFSVLLKEAEPSGVAH